MVRCEPKTDSERKHVVKTCGSIRQTRYDNGHQHGTGG